MQDLGEDLGRFHSARARAVEELVAVGEDTPGRSRTATGRATSGRSVSGRHFVPSAGNVEPAGEDATTSGSCGEIASTSIHGGACRLRPKTVEPPAIETSSGTQFPAAISGSIHSMQATVGRCASRRGAVDRDVVEPALQAGDEHGAALGHFERACNLFDAFRIWVLASLLRAPPGGSYRSSGGVGCSGVVAMACTNQRCGWAGYRWGRGPDWATTGVIRPVTEV